MNQKDRLEGEIELLKAKLKCLEDELSKIKSNKEPIGFKFSCPIDPPKFTLGEVIKYETQSRDKGSWVYFVGPKTSMYGDDKVYVNGFSLYPYGKHEDMMGVFQYRKYDFQFVKLNDGDVIITSVRYTHSEVFFNDQIEDGILCPKT